MYPDPPSLCEEYPDIPRAVEQVVLKGLSTKPAQISVDVLSFGGALEEASQAVSSPKLLSSLPAIRHFEARSSMDSMDIRYQNVSVPLTPLIGRERELLALHDLLLCSEVRLVTLTGTGGIGKTHLALTLGNEFLEVFAQGVCFVSLSTIHDSELVIPAITHALGLPEGKDRSSIGRLKTFLRDKQLLLMLDNFEQVLLKAPLLADLLSSCTQLKILVTSRALLHIEGEYVFPVPPLEIPDTRQVLERESLSQVASVALFVQRTQAMLPGFQLTIENARDIAAICTRLEGVPLAIELAAAQSKLFSPKSLLSRLEHPLEVLTGGRRDAPPRQQTLFKTLSWNDDLLSPDEQTLFRRLAVFAGGCSLQAIEAVSAALGSLKISVLDGVRSLIDTSLVQCAPSGEDEPRLSLLEMIRLYALERLAECGELEQTRDAHADYYLALAEEAESDLSDTDQTAWQKWLEQEASNLRAALLWLLERKKMEEALRLSRLLGDTRGEASSLTCMSTIFHDRGKGATALTVLPVRSAEPLFPPAYEELTAREIEVLRLLAMGLSNKQIAGHLILSPHTVNGHIHSIFGKLALNSRSAATRYALEHQLA